MNNRYPVWQKWVLICLMSSIFNLSAEPPPVPQPAMASSNTTSQPVSSEETVPPLPQSTPEEPPQSSVTETCPHATYTSSGQLHISLLDVDLFGHTRQTFEVELQQRSEEFIFEIMTVKPLPLCDYYGISITSPQPGELSEAFFTVSGTYAVKPPQDSLQLFNVLPNKQHYWPQPRETIQFDPFNKTWHGDFYLGGEPPQEALIMVAIMQESGRILSDYYAKVGQETDMWPALDALTADIIECDQVLIIKVK